MLNARGLHSAKRAQLNCTCKCSGPRHPGDHPSAPLIGAHPTHSADGQREAPALPCCHPKIIVSPDKAFCRHFGTSPSWEDAGGLRWQGLCSHVDSSPHQAGASGWQGLCSYGSTSLRRALWHSCWKKSARVRYPTMRCTLSQGRRLSLVVRDQRDSPARARNPHPTPTARGLTGL